MKNQSKNRSWPLVGNEYIIQFLSKSIIKGSVAGSYVFYGPEDLGKTTLAIYFAKTLLCEKRDGALACGECPSCQKFRTNNGNEARETSFVHSDLFIVKKPEDKKNISIEQARDLIRQLSLSSFLNSYKIGIIKDASALSIDAANALLKTLEEPKNKVVIILITSNLDVLPQTIVSRSQIIRFKPVGADTIYDYLVKEQKAKRSVAKNLSRLALGRPALAVKFYEDKDFFNNYLKRVKSFVTFFYNDINQRFAAIDDLLRKGSGQETVKMAKEELDIWERLARDIILYKFGQIDLAQHWVIDSELETVSQKVTTNQLIDLLNNIQISRDYLEANVNPKTILENAAMNIT